jgi:hypothetical protein
MRSAVVEARVKYGNSFWLYKYEVKEVEWKFTYIAHSKIDKAFAGL